MGITWGSWTPEEKLHLGAAFAHPLLCTEEWSYEGMGWDWGWGLEPLPLRSTIWVFHLELFT